MEPEEKQERQQQEKVISYLLAIVGVLTLSTNPFLGGVLFAGAWWTAKHFHSGMSEIWDLVIFFGAIAGILAVVFQL